MLNRDLSLALDPVLFSSQCFALQPDKWQADVLRGGYKEIADELQPAMWKE